MNESVELVRAARLERAVPFTNAVMRRLADGLRELLEALPDGPLKHSYPDWIAETWWRDWGEEEALALMRAQNEAPETVVRLVRGEIDGEPTDVPGAYRVDRVDERALAEGRIWPQSRGSQLAGLAVGARQGERCSTSAPPPAGRRRCSPARSSRSSCTRGARASSRRTSAASGATNVRVVNADALALPPELTGFDRALVDAPCSGLGVLAARPDLRWRAQPLPELQLALLARGGGARAARAGRSSTRSARSTPTRTRRSSTRPGSRSTTSARSGRVPPSEAARVPADDPAPPRHVRLLRRAAAGLRSRSDAGISWIRTVEVEPSLYAADFSRLGEQIEILLRAGARVFHFDVGDGHFVEPVTIGPIVLESIAPLIHREGGAIDCHLMVDDPEHHFGALQTAGADSVTFHFEAVDDPPCGRRAGA